MGFIGRYLLQWFVPIELRADTELRRNAIRSLVFGLAMVFWAPIFAPVHQWVGSPRSAGMIGLAAIAILASMISLRITRSPYVTGILLAAVMFGLFVGLACVSGGIEAASLWWLPSVPIIALVLCGITAGIVWALVSCLACVVFFACAEFGVVFPNDIIPAKQPWLDVAAICGIILCASTLTLAFKLGEAAARSELEAARDASERANRAKSLFLANMSHEIRTPMNAIIGMTELVLGMKLAPDQREYLSVVQESGESLLTLINDILDFSKIEARKLHLDCERFDLHRMLGDAIKALSFQARKRGLGIHCDIRMDVPRIVVGDQGRLRQVIVNLVDNAIKFTEQGEIVLKVEQSRETSESVYLRFSVTDTGIGIPADKRQVIFDTFSQADMSSTRRYGGTGLGLAISSQLVTMMDGQIDVESEVGRGSTFHFTARFDLVEQEAADVATRLAPGLTETRVLVVGGDATNRQMLEETLRSWGIMPMAVESACQALGLMRHAQQMGKPYHLVLADTHPVDVDGFALAQRIKEEPMVACPVLLLAAPDQPVEAGRWQQAGIATSLVKPVTPPDLFDAIQGALGDTSLKDVGANATHEESSPPLKPFSVLLVEDSLVNQKLAVAVLRKVGYRVSTASNGREALETLESQAFDLILMDIQMPEMDGLEATQAIRAKEETTRQHIPIIAMTAHALPGDRERFLGAGMDEYVAKPIRAEKLLETIEAILASSSEGGLATT